MMHDEIRIITHGDVRVYVVPINRNGEVKQREAERAAVETLTIHAFGPGVTISHKPTGRPYVNISGFEGDISISHCRDYAAIGVVEKGKVGIDIECHRAQLQRIARRFLNEREHAEYGQCMTSLLKAWTMKEAIFKCRDEGGLTIGAIDLLENDVDTAVVEVDAENLLAIARME